MLLACGIGYAISYIIANDTIAARRYPGYRARDQAISELSARGAPSRPFLNGMLPVFTALLGGFGAGVRTAGRSNEPLRWTSNLLIGTAVLGPLWLLFPMSTREDLAKNNGGANDLGHVVLGLLSITFILGQMATSAIGLGKRFRYLSGATALLTIGGWGYVLTSTTNVASGGRTPWMGLVERIAYGSWLVWMGALSVTLLWSSRREHKI